MLTKLFKDLVSDIFKNQKSDSASSPFALQDIYEDEDGNRHINCTVDSLKNLDSDKLAALLSEVGRAIREENETSENVDDDDIAYNIQDDGTLFLWYIYKKNLLEISEKETDFILDILKSVAEDFGYQDMSEVVRCIRDEEGNEERHMEGKLCPPPDMC